MEQPLVASEQLARGSVDLGYVICTEDMQRRVSRPADYEAENRVILHLASTMAERPSQVLQELVDSARSLCRAESAGISLLDGETDASGRKRFRWVATSGGFAPYAGNTMPRDFSPCGAVLDANRMLFMKDPVRHFAYIEALPIPVREVLLVPFYRGDSPIGTVWIASHTAEHHFDREDARLVTNLSQFAAAAMQVIDAAAASVELESTARTRALTELAAMTEADREKSQFLAMLSHELRNALSPFANALRIIKLSAARDARESARDMMDRQLRQLTRLVDDLMDGSRIASGKLSLTLAEENLIPIVHQAIDAARNRIESGGQTLTVALPSEQIRIQCDKERIAQVLGNLLTNAAKYGRPGGQVNVTMTAGSGYATVSIEDDGIGIEPKILPRLFDLFVQSDRSVPQSEGGLGIGLSLVKHLVESHGGTVTAHSAGLNRGSRFVVQLPLAGADSRI